jgi:hypothetical protein
MRYNTEKQSTHIGIIVWTITDINKILYCSNVESFAGSSKLNFRSIEASCSRSSKRLVYPPCWKLGAMLEELTNILVEVIRSAILSTVLLDSSPTNKTHKKETHYFHLVQI